MQLGVYVSATVRLVGKFVQTHTHTHSHIYLGIGCAVSISAGFGLPVAATACHCWYKKLTKKPNWFYRKAIVRQPQAGRRITAVTVYSIYDHGPYRCCCCISLLQQQVMNLFVAVPLYWKSFPFRLAISAICCKSKWVANYEYWLLAQRSTQ